MLTIRKQTILNLILTAVLLPAAAVCAETVEYDGLIEPYVVVEIGSSAEGIVAEVIVERSDSVKAGQILVEMESSVERAAVEKAKAMVTFDGEIGLQKTQLAFAKRVHGRVRKLDAIATHDKDQAKTEISRARLRLKQAHEKSTLARLELKKAQAILNRCSINRANMSTVSRCCGWRRSIRCGWR
jgi:multidrug efflux pump subunit AcrA (membrane-fusion protein)